jgi:hypothetical protein
VRLLLLALLLVSGKGWGAYASGTLAYWDLPSVTDPVNAYNLTMGGTVPTVDVACDGTQMSGPYTTSNKYTAPSGFNTALAAVTGVTYETYIYLTTAATGAGAVGIIFRGNGTPAAWELYISAASFPMAANWRRYNGSWDGVATGSILNQNTCYHIACTTDGTTMKIYVDNVEKGSKNVAVSLASAVSSWVIGTDTSSVFASGYLSGFRVSSVVRTSFPTVDPSDSTPAPSLMSPFLRQILTPRLAPPVLR